MNKQTDKPKLEPVSFSLAPGTDPKPQPAKEQEIRWQKVWSKSWLSNPVNVTKESNKYVLFYHHWVSEQDFKKSSGLNSIKFPTSVFFLASTSNTLVTD